MHDFLLFCRFLTIYDIVCTALCVVRFCLFLFRVNVKLSRDNQRMISSELGGYDTIVEARCMGCDVEIGQKYVCRTCSVACVCT